MKLDRREFVFSLAALASRPPAELRAQERSPGQSGNPSLTSAELETLDHLCEQIIPADDQPGARELGVSTFIRRLLDEAHPEWLEVYRNGLAATESACRREHGKTFVKIDFERQTALLQRMEGGELPAEDWKGMSQEAFFGLVRSHAMNGYYAHPRWGGNQSKKAWEMIGYDDWWA